MWFLYPLPWPAPLSLPSPLVHSMVTLMSPTSSRTIESPWPHLAQAHPNSKTVRTQQDTGS